MTDQLKKEVELTLEYFVTYINIDEDAKKRASRKIKTLLDKAYKAGMENGIKDANKKYWKELFYGEEKPSERIIKKVFTIADIEENFDVMWQEWVEGGKKDKRVWKKFIRQQIIELLNTAPLGKFSILPEDEEINIKCARGRNDHIEETKDWINKIIK